jgi:serine protease inhibitor
MFFKAAWFQKFDVNLTRMGPFDLSDGGVVSVHYMQATGKMQVYRMSKK